MHSPLFDSLPRAVRRDLNRLGEHIAVARRKRHLTAAMMAERLGVAYTTYRRIERGDPTVAVGMYAMALFVLDLPGSLSALAEPARDELGLGLDEARLPQRVRPARLPTTV